MNKIELAKILWDYLRLNQKVEKCDCILGMGCHDIKVAEYAAFLYHKGYADKIIFTGGYGKITKQLWKKPEAEKFAFVAMNLGVPKENIYIETESTNTGDNLKFVKELIQKQGLSIDSFLIVHKPYAERRIYAAFQALMPDKRCIVTSFNLSFEEYMEQQSEFLREETIHLMVGDLQRIKVYPKYGWQVEQEIPSDVEEAYHQLIKLGYDKYMISQN